jgi:hypothetical protein
MRERNCDLVVTPGGMTSQPEPRDVSVNEPSKDYFRKEMRLGRYLKTFH